MSIAEKKAAEVATEQLDAAVAAFNEATGMSLAAEIDYAPLEGNEEAITKAANVPCAILGDVQSLVADADYKEAVSGMSTFKFVPVLEADGFDYNASAELGGSAITVQYLPMQSNHGGYEASIKGLF